MQIRAKAPRIDRRLVNHEQDEKDRVREQTVLEVRKQAEMVREAWENLMRSINDHTPQIPTKAHLIEPHK